jgi:hypothetical protein
MLKSTTTEIGHTYRITDTIKRFRVSNVDVALVTFSIEVTFTKCLTSLSDVIETLIVNRDPG